MWVILGVATTTASQSPESMRSRWLSKIANSRPPDASRASCCEGRCGSATAVTAAPSIASMFPICSTPIIPVPMTP